MCVLVGVQEKSSRREQHIAVVALPSRMFRRRSQREPAVQEKPPDVSDEDLYRALAASGSGAAVMVVMMMSLQQLRPAMRDDPLTVQLKKALPVFTGILVAYAIFRLYPRWIDQRQKKE